MTIQVRVPRDKVLGGTRDRKAGPCKITEPWGLGGLRRPPVGGPPNLACPPPLLPQKSLQGTGHLQ